MHLQAQRRDSRFWSMFLKKLNDFFYIETSDPMSHKNML